MTPAIYLTFDDGPNPGTLQVLDALGDGIKATFFLCSGRLAESPGPRYRLVRRMIDAGHLLGNHGHDHDPMTRRGYLSTTTDAVRADFDRGTLTFEAIFKDHADSFPGFTMARLPGDGRTFPSYVAMITNEVKLPHVGWGSEIAPGGTFRRREKKRNAAHEPGDFYTDWIPGVSATVPPGSWPPPDDIVLLHEAHWTKKKSLLEKLIQKLGEKRTIAPMMPLPAGHQDIRPVGWKPA